MENASFDLSGRVAIVTGTSRGLGQYMGRALARAGADLVITSRHIESLAEFQAEIEALGRRAFPVELDVRDQSSIERMAEAAFSHYGKIDILVNNAGATWGAPAEDYPPEAWMKVINLNVNGMFFLTQEVGKRAFIPQKSGKVIVTASIAGLRGNPPDMQTIAYNTSKGADVNFVRALAAEWGKYNINVNAICPGFFPSKMSQGLLATIEKIGRAS
ncbi:MAG: hypothetical protein QG656_1462, partial [Candidatus Hydrogenedentes bacterium]|nr:hypothetical protein [Candidatus Hydrogenedentota bacterium]